MPEGFSTPEQEAHERATHTPPEQEQKEGLAKREFVTDEEGRIVDVRFTQHGKTRRLKELLPGTYTIAFYTHEELAKRKKQHYGLTSTYHVLQDTMKLIPLEEGIETEGEQNITLLHEAGHAVDLEEKKGIFVPLVEERLVAGFKLAALECRLLDLRNNGGTAYLHVFSAGFKKGLERDNLARYLPADFCQSLPEQMERYCAALREQTVNDHDVGAQEQYLNAVEAKSKALEERGAWAKMLKAYRTLQNDSIRVYPGTTSDLLEEIDYDLGSHHLAHYEHVAPETPFVKNRQFKALLDEVYMKIREEREQTPQK